MLRVREPRELDQRPLLLPYPPPLLTSAAHRRREGGGNGEGSR